MVANKVYYLTGIFMVAGCFISAEEKTVGVTQCTLEQGAGEAFTCAAEKILNRALVKPENTDVQRIEKCEYLGKALGVVQPHFDNMADSLKKLDKQFELTCADKFHDDGCARVKEFIVRWRLLNNLREEARSSLRKACATEFVRYDYPPFPKSLVERSPLPK